MPIPLSHDAIAPVHSRSVNRDNSRARQEGFGLIEVMIAIVVLSVGLFGIVLAQLNALNSQRSAHMRSAAVQLVSDMAERMRLNVAAIGDPNAYADAASTTYASLTGATTTATTTLPASFASAKDQADYDVGAWRSEIGRRLGSGSATGVVRQVTGQPNSRSVVVMWLEKQPTTELATGIATRGNTCSAGTTASALLCDPNCPQDGTVNGAPANVRCIRIGVQP